MTRLGKCSEKTNVQYHTPKLIHNSLSTVSTIFSSNSTFPGPTIPYIPGPTIPYIQIKGRKFGYMPFNAPGNSNLSERGE